MQATQGSGVTCQFSKDCRYVYYLKTRTGGEIWRLELATGGTVRAGDEAQELEDASRRHPFTEFSFKFLDWEYYSQVDSLTSERYLGANLP